MTDVALPQGVVTFLFTDIEGSTHLVQAHGDAWPDLLATHFELMTGALAPHGGHEVGTRGDAVFVAFDDAGRALAAALDAQAALVAHPWPEPPIKVRIGIHTGEAVVRKHDYVGLAVHEAARICAAGHGGQVLCSAATLAFAGGPPEGANSVDLGPHRLKDLPEPTRLHQLTRPGLPSVFAGVRADAVPGNLPKAITSFVGRDGERADAAGRLRSGARLLTLTGSGGSGKTRLGLQVAADVVDGFTHGAWLVELAGVSEPSAVPAAIAAALQVRDEHGNSDVGTIATALAGRRLLVVLDNCEHLLDAAAAVTHELLTRCPDLAVLATSQEALGLPGEAVLAVGSLPDHEAVRLFAERAAERRRGFALDPTNTAAVTAICRRLDGIPLAIELAAGRVAALSVEEIADLLHDQFRLLTGGSRAAMPRQQTLRAAVDWSYALLGEDEQILLARLATFSGGWNLEAAMAVGGFEPLFAIDVVDGLARLVARSLVIVEEQNNASRYRLLSTIRQYALERLSDRGDVGACRDRHAAHFSALALAAEPELMGPEQAEWLARLAADDANLRAALDWLGTDGLDVAVALWRYWLVRGDWSGGRTWLERGLSERDIDVPDPTVARALDAAGALATEQGDHEAAEPYLNYALLQWRSLRDYPAGIARTLNHLGTLARTRFAYDEARAHLQEALARADESGDPRHRAISLRNLGLLSAQQADHETARTRYDEALPIARTHGDKRLVATLTHALSQVAFADGDRVTAAELADEGLALARELGDRQTVAEHLTVLAGIAAADGDSAAAAAHLGEALALWNALGASRAVPWLHTTLGEMALTANDAEAACAHLNQAVIAWRDFGDDAALARILNLAGWAALEAGEHEIAERTLDEAVALARHIDDDAQLAAALHSRGELARRVGDPNAGTMLTESLQSAQDAGWRTLLWWPTWSLAALAREEGRYELAHELLEQAEAVCPKLGRAPRMADVKEEAAALARARGDDATAEKLLDEAHDLRTRFNLGAFTMG